jgi:NAD dependent epimerase/dehydratase family enzyme
MLFGEMGKEALLGGLAIEPAVLGRNGFTFQHPQLDAALRSELGR